MKALNPYSVKLGRPEPFYEITGKPLYRNGHYSVYKYESWFVYLYKNIILTERTGLSNELVDRFANNDEPTDYSKLLFQHAIEALKVGKKYARKNGFKIR